MVSAANGYAYLGFIDFHILIFFLKMSLNFDCDCTGYQALWMTGPILLSSVRPDITNHDIAKYQAICINDYVCRSNI